MIKGSNSKYFVICLMNAVMHQYFGSVKLRSKCRYSNSPGFIAIFTTTGFPTASKQFITIPWIPFTSRLTKRNRSFSTSRFRDMKILKLGLIDRICSNYIVELAWYNKLFDGSIVRRIYLVVHSLKGLFFPVRSLQFFGEKRLSINVYF